MTTRRRFLTYLGVLSVGVGGLQGLARGGNGRGAAWKEGAASPAGGARDSDVMEEALERLAPFGPSFRGGLSNHGPMTAEAMLAIGHGDAVIPWIEDYIKYLDAEPTSREPIEKSGWAEALGDRSRTGDWTAWFRSELAEAPWREVVGRWIPHLAPGVAAAGLHGVIRVGHAACSLEVQESALRLDELARALGYWAAEYLPFPGDISGKGKLSASQALKQVERLPHEQRTGGGLITSELKALIGFAPFAAAIDLVDPKAGSPSFMEDLLAANAGLFINTNSSSFEFLHAVTGSAAIAELLAYVKASQSGEVMAYTWQATAGIFARYAQAGLVAEVTGKASEQSFEQLANLAVASGDEHTIKLACACTREWLRNPDPRFLAAASKRVRRG